MPLIDLQQLNKLYYSIGEVSSMFGVNASLIRFWEKEFGFEIAKKTKKGNRLFTVKEIEKINKIYQLVKLDGFTIDGAKKKLGQKDKTTFVQVENDTNAEQIRFLEYLKSKLLSLKENQTL
ncbi:MAG: MerR family transcriptional regulator [Bacteroidetes bacterium]|nr:MerR family transcriptional regulator [Bacteroidota bacterium]